MVDSLETRLLPEVLVENPMAFSTREQWPPVHPFVGQVNTSIAALGVLAGFQLDLGR